MASLVVGRNGNVDELGWRVGIAESEDWDVDVAGLLNGLSVGAGVGNDDEAGLFERTGDVVGEVTRGETTSDGDSSGVGGKLEDSALTVGTSRDDTDVGWVVDRGDDASCKNNLLPVTTQSALSYLLVMKPSRNHQHLPRLANVDHIDSVWTSFPQVRLHVNLQVLGP